MLNRVSFRFQTSLFGVLAAMFLLFGSACGGQEEDPCKDQVCDFGVCSSESGQCVNPSHCTRTSECRPGFTCGATGKCEPNTTCESDSDCQTGVCKEGACVNPGECSSNDECLERTFCYQGGDSSNDAGMMSSDTSSGTAGTCQPDPCADKTCQRGVCESGTGACVSKDSCTKETALLDCVSGQKCADGTCEAEETYCDEITCDRGVCSFAEGGCVEASDCSEDSECLEGRFCNGMNRCQTDLCVQNSVDCQGNGTCQPSTGECVSQTSCQSNDACAGNEVCIDGTCGPAASACGDAGGDGGCPGNQMCEYDEDNLTAQCQEPESCETSFDCTDDRVCGGETCLSAPSCKSDGFEPNNSESETTNFSEVAPQGTLEATVCDSDTDYYEYDTADFFKESTSGKLVVQVDVPQRAQGLGKLTVEVFDKDGNSMGTASTGALGADGSARFSQSLMISDDGVYTIKVSSDSDLKTSGVFYNLSVDMMPQETIDACQNAQVVELQNNTRLSGTTADQTSTSLGSSCTSADNSSPEKIYAFHLESPQEVSFDLQPQLSSTDLSMSLRDSCTQAASETSCTNANGDGGDEQFTQLLAAGTHYLVVQSPSEKSGGAFQLNVNTIYTACGPGSGYCDSDGSANVCSSNGGRYNTIECDNGCNTATGRCFPPSGDVCRTAETIDPQNASARTVALDQDTNQYQVSEGNCLDGSPTKTGGPDQTFAVEVPKEKSVILDAIFQNEVDGSLYLVGDCGDTDGTCKVGSKEKPEQDDDSSSSTDYVRQIQYSNMSMSDETLYVVVDTAANQSVTTAELQVTYKDVICQPDAKQCTSADAVETCNEYGTAFNQTDTCWNCVNGACQADTCNSPLDVSADARKSGGYDFQAPISSFADTYDADVDTDACPGFDSDIDAEGADVVLQVQVKANEVLKVSQEFTGSGSEDVTTAIVDSCGQPTSMNCQAGMTDTGGDPTSLTYYPGAAKTVYVIADSDEDPGGSLSSEDVKMNVELTPTQCTPGSFSATCNGDTLRSCSSNALYKDQKCVSCSSASCLNPTCSNPQDITTAAKQSGGTTVEAALAPLSDDIAGDVDTSACPDIDDGSFVSDVEGHDAVFKVSLKSGEVLEVEEEIVNTSASSVDPTLSIIDSCGDLSSSNCLSAEAGSGTSRAAYLATSPKDVYVVADTDSTSDLDGVNMKLHAEVTSSQCDPSTYSASACTSDGFAYKRCSNIGKFDYLGCEYGCSGGSCNTSGTIKTCPNPRDVTAAAGQAGGVLVEGEWDDYSQNQNGSGCGVSSSDTDGPDAVWQVQLNAGQTLNADILSSTGIVTYEGVYIMSGCTLSSMTCLSGSQGSGPQSASYTANGSETVFVLVDTDYTFTTGDTFDLKMQVQ